MTDAQRRMMNGPITIREIYDAVKKMNKGRAPVPDGLLASSYKYFQDELLLPLQKMLNSILDNGKIPDS